MESYNAGPSDSIPRVLRHSPNYDHSRFEVRRCFLRWLVNNIGYKTIAKLDSIEGLENVPPEGPALVIFNHIALIDPIVIACCLPRNVVPFAKEEAYHDILVGILPRMWEAIPVKRGEMDRKAIQYAIKVLEAGEMLLIAPEGTRNPSLQRGKEGIAYLGYRSGAPIIPVAVEGTENFPAITPPRRKLSGVNIRIGPAFHFRDCGRRPPMPQLTQMTDEAMYQLAKLLPVSRRGIYADLERATTKTLSFV